nr:type IX secretion system membrane protein PorP/SprF [uncultured Flavobacterium sp.]
MFCKLKLLFFIFLLQYSTYSQEGLPVYSDYLTDNYYLLHPSMAGAANCDKLRITGRKQWFGQEDAPELQTVSFNSRVGEKSGAGVIIFNDKNGYHSQKGIKLTYAHHIMFSRDEIDLNQLSFGMSAGFIQSQLDETTFTDYDPIIFGQVQKSSYFNLDFGMSYNFLNFYAHATVQGAIETRRALYSKFESNNLRKYLLSTGYVFGNKETILWEPSILLQLIDRTKEKLVDLNIKVYKELPIGAIWVGLSYRRIFERVQYSTTTGIVSQKLQYITPFLGFNYKNIMVAYTYSKVSGPVLFDTGGYHQITLGMNLFCKAERYDCHCPAIN